MKYCISYNKNFKYIDKIDELNIDVKRTDLMELVVLHPQQRINICIRDEEDFIEHQQKYIKLFNTIVTDFPENDFALKLRDYKDNKVKEILNIIKENENKFKFFFETFIKDWDTLMGYIELHPSDIYIVENLGFEIERIAKLLHSKGIKVRAFPNVAQSSWKDTPALRKFFIRPEDINLYEKYIDVIEFFNEENVSTYYKIYAIDKKWFGKLNEIILDFNDNEIDNRCILSNFAERRINCGKRCYKGFRCDCCKNVEDLAKILKENNLIIKNNL